MVAVHRSQQRRNPFQVDLGADASHQDAPSGLPVLVDVVDGPARVADLVSALGLAQSTVSKHLACLRGCGLVDSEPVGRASLFRLTQPALIDVLASAEAVLVATGNAVALCPTFGVGTGVEVER